MYAHLECTSCIIIVTSEATEYVQLSAVSIFSHDRFCEEAKVVVGLDFGTTFSGFAYALRAQPENVYTFYDWPMQAQGGGLPYCKTQTSLLYYADSSNASEDSFELCAWGWPAYVEYKFSNSPASKSGNCTASDFDFEVVHDFDDLPSVPGAGQKASESKAGQARASDVGHAFLTLFKLHLSSDGSLRADSLTSAPDLPPGMLAKRAVSDYLSEISKTILQEVKNSFGPHVTLEDIQWCVTVPAIWDDQSKREFRDCTEIAGLVQGPLSKGAGSPHSLNLFTEPEAASIYCQQRLPDQPWSKGDKFLVVDCGGGTVDLVLHEKLGAPPTLSMREVQASSGDYCGGSGVDDEFFRFMRSKVHCFQRFEREYPTVALDFHKTWELMKYGFNGDNGNSQIELPPKLADLWQNEQMISSTALPSTIDNYYDELAITNDDMKSIFDPVVTRILQLVEERMVRDLHAILVVGGFSASPYLMRRIRESFESRVASIVCPSNPGGAVCYGAVTMGIQSGIVVSRISKKTYGFRQAKPFIAGVHSEDFKVESGSGQFFCDNVFGKYVKKGDEVRYEAYVRHIYTPVSKTQGSLKIDLYSSDCESVQYVTDFGSKREGTFMVKIPTFEELGFKPRVEITMYFGHAEIQVSASGKNFDSDKRDMLPVKFERDGIY